MRLVVCSAFVCLAVLVNLDVISARITDAQLARELLPELNKLSSSQRRDVFDNMDRPPSLATQRKLKIGRKLAYPDVARLSSGALIKLGNEIIDNGASASSEDKINSLLNSYSEGTSSDSSSSSGVSGLIGGRAGGLSEILGGGAGGGLFSKLTGGDGGGILEAASATGLIDGVDIGDLIENFKGTGLIDVVNGAGILGGGAGSIPEILAGLQTGGNDDDGLGDDTDGDWGSEELDEDGDFDFGDDTDWGDDWE